MGTTQAARCGFADICKLLLDAGAPKDLANSIGWTPLHECAFYGHVDVCRLLMVYGASATHEDGHGAVPYHVASLPGVRDVLREMGGPGAAPEGAVPSGQTFRFTALEDAAVQPVIAEGKDAPSNRPSGAVEGGAANGAFEMRVPRTIQLASRGVAATVVHPASRGVAATVCLVRRSGPERPVEVFGDVSERPNRAAVPQVARAVDVADDEDDAPVVPAEPEFLHRGEKLGELPSLTPAKDRRAAERAREIGRGAASAERAARISPGGPSPAVATPTSPQEPDDAPAEFLCAVSRRKMTDPLVSPYGHVFEGKVIRAWFAKNGSVCPLTGQPLVWSELRPAEALKTKIRNWEITRSISSNAAADLAARSPESAAKGDAVAAADDDALYDF